MQTPISRKTLTATATTSSYHNHKHERNHHESKPTTANEPLPHLRKSNPQPASHRPAPSTNPRTSSTLARVQLALSEI
ncbi:hypothetical protein E2542_SST19988 [Spatholobus suberectus]|nr:hypothetical protein E2542_SST19988 [Spatholobus suberectus]